MNLLLKVEGAFEISDWGGLFVTPTFKLPDHGFEQTTIRVVIRAPDGTERDAEADLVIPHFVLVGGRGEYRVQMRFKDMQKSQVPIGSEIFTESEVARDLEIAD